MKKYIIAFGLFCISLFLIDNVYAIDGSYSSANFQILMMSSPSDGTSSSSGYSDGLNVSHSLNGKYLLALYIQVYGSDSIVYKAGNTYTFTFRVNFNPKKWNYLDNNYTTSNMDIFGSENASSSGMSTDNISSSSLSISNMSNDTYGMIYTFKFVPNTDLKYILFRCRYPHSLMGPDLNYVYALNTVRVVNLSVTYQQGMGAAIDDQTIIIQNQTDQIINTQQQTNDKLDSLNGNITNSDSSGATNDASGFFEGFTTDTFGLTSIITAPLNLIQNITSPTCTPLTLSLPYINQNVSIPCMTEIYRSYFGSFLTVYQVITFGLVSYWVCVHVFRMVKDFKNPDHDEIEVVDL